MRTPRGCAKTGTTRKVKRLAATSSLTFEPRVFIDFMLFQISFACTIQLEAPHDRRLDLCSACRSSTCGSLCNQDRNKSGLIGRMRTHSGSPDSHVEPVAHWAHLFQALAQRLQTQHSRCGLT